MGKSLIRNEDGMAMVLVIMAMLVFSLLGTAALSMANSNVDNSLLEREFQSAFYVAEAGVNYHTEVIKNKNIKEAFNSTSNANEFFTHLENHTDTTYGTEIFQPQSGYDPVAEVSLQRLNMSETNPRTYALVSIGITENTKRTVVKEIIVKWNAGFDTSGLHTLYAKESMYIKGIVDGTIGVSYSLPEKYNLPGNPPPPPIKFDWGAECHNYFVPDDEEVNVSMPNHFDEVNIGVRQKIANNIEYKIPDFPEFPDVYVDKGEVELKNAELHQTLNLTDSVTYLSKIEIGNSSRLTIDLNGEDRTLIVDDLIFSQGAIFLKNKGSLNLYVKNHMTFGGSTVLNHADPPENYETMSFNYIKNSAKVVPKEKMYDSASALTIYIKGTNKLVMDQDISVCGSIYCETADVDLGGSSLMGGSLVTGGAEVVADGGSDIYSTMIYAPLAHVKIEGSAKINGPVISNTLEHNGGSEGIVKFNPDEDDIPVGSIFPQEAKVIFEGSVLEQ